MLGVEAAADYARPREQFGDGRLRHFYHLWRGRVALVTGGAAVLGLCGVLSGGKLLDAYQVRQEVFADRAQESRASEEYARLPAKLRETLGLEKQPVWLDVYNGRINVVSKKIYDERMQLALASMADDLKTLDKMGLR